MATVTQLADRVSQVTGYGPSTNAAERAVVLLGLNYASDYACMEIGNHVGPFSVSLTADDGDYVIKDAPWSLTDLLELRLMRATADGSTYPMKQVSESRMEELRRGQGFSGIPRAFAMAGSTEIRIWPTPQAGVVLTGTYVKEPKVLVESGAGAGEETTPSWLPRALHEEVIANGAIMYVMERENRFEEAQVFRARFELGIERASMWTARIGGPTIDDDLDTHLGFERDRDRS